MKKYSKYRELDLNRKLLQIFNSDEADENKFSRDTLSFRQDGNRNIIKIILNKDIILELYINPFYDPYIYLNLFIYRKSILFKVKDFQFGFEWHRESLICWIKNFHLSIIRRKSKLNYKYRKACQTGDIFQKDKYADLWEKIKLADDFLSSLDFIYGPRKIFQFINYYKHTICISRKEERDFIKFYEETYVKVLILLARKCSPTSSFYKMDKNILKMILLKV